MKPLGRHLNYANVVATLALLFAMSGSALAAKHYLINSTRQINPKVLRALRGNVGPAGAKGATGAAGVAGSPGSPGKEGPQGKEGQQGKEGPSKLSAIKEAFSGAVFAAPERSGRAAAKCPKGTRAISGSSFMEAEPGQPAPNVYDSFAPIGRAEWVVEVDNPSKIDSIFIEAVAYCAGENEAVAG